MNNKVLKLVEPLEDEAKLPLIKMAELIIDFLNLKTGKKFRAKNPRGEETAMSAFVVARLKEGYTVSDCRAVVAAKFRQWGADEKMAKYLTPETLFRRSNFERYLGELDD